MQGTGQGGSTKFGSELRINSPGLRSTGGVTAAAGKREDVLKDPKFSLLPPPTVLPVAHHF